MELNRAQFPHLNEAQWGALSKMQCILGPDGLAHLLAQDADAQVERTESFIRYENALLDHVRGALQTQQAPTPVVSSGTKPLHLKVKPFTGDEAESLLLWFRETEMAMQAALLMDERQRVAFAVSHLGGRARQWALTRDSTVEGAFPTWEYLKHEIRVMFLPPNAAYQVRSRFLASRQGKRELAKYVQELRTLFVGMISDPLPEIVKVTIFMEGLRVGPARTQLFRAQPTSFEGRCAYCYRQARTAGHLIGAPTPKADGPQPMELGSAEQRSTIKCYGCGQSGHMQCNCPRSSQRNGRGRFDRSRRGGRSWSPRPPGGRSGNERFRGQGNAYTQ